MPLNFYGGDFFQGDFFGTQTAAAPAADLPVGGKGDNGDGLRIVKPTGLKPRRTLHAKHADVQRRLDESAQIAAEVAGRFARDLEGERLARDELARQEALRVLTAREVEFEIGVLLRKKIRTEEDEILLLLLMAAAAA